MQVGDLVGGTGFWLFRMGTPLLWLIYWPAALHVALVFPRPLRVLQKAATLIPGIYIGSLAIFVGLLAWNWYRAENLLVWLNTWGPAGNLIAGLYLAATMAGLVLQTRRRLTGTERLQIRWVVFGAMVSGIGSQIGRAHV